MVGTCAYTCSVSRSRHHSIAVVEQVGKHTESWLVSLDGGRRVYARQARVECHGPAGQRRSLAAAGAANQAANLASTSSTERLRHIVVGAFVDAFDPLVRVRGLSAPAPVRSRGVTRAEEERGC